jgi:hypothetical protein
MKNSHSLLSDALQIAKQTHHQIGLRLYNNLEKGSESARERINAKKTHQGPIIKQKYSFPNCCERIHTRG